jgi:hypothetical protein
MIGFLTQDISMTNMVKTKIRYIPLNVGQVGHFRTPKILGNPSDREGTLDGSRLFVHIFKVVDNVSYMGVHDPIYTNRLLSSGVVTEHDSSMGKSMNNIHLCKNLRLGL